MGLQPLNDAVEVYTNGANTKHFNLKVEDSEFIIDQKYPFVGASPDGVLHCLCCGEAIVEVKCPYCINDGLPKDGEVPTFSMMKQACGIWTLKRDHPYFNKYRPSCMYPRGCIVTLLYGQIMTF